MAAVGPLSARKELLSGLKIKCVTLPLSLDMERNAGSVKSYLSEELSEQMHTCHFLTCPCCAGMRYK